MNEMLARRDKEIAQLQEERYTLALALLRNDNETERHFLDKPFRGFVFGIVASREHPAEGCGLFQWKSCQDKDCNAGKHPLCWKCKFTRGVYCSCESSHHVVCEKYIACS